MESYSRENRIKEALLMRGLKQVELCEKTGLNKSALNSWLNQRWQPKQDALYKMAKALDVSEMWLAGYDVPMERPQSRRKADALADLLNTLKSNERYMELLDSIVKLDDDQLLLIESMVKQLKPNND